MSGPLMTAVCAAIAVTGYAFALWRLACGVARRRGLELGRLPATGLALSALAPAALSVAGASHAQTALWCVGIVGALMCAIVDMRTGLIFDALTAVSGAAVLLVALVGGQVGAGCLGAAVVGTTLLAMHLATRRRGLGLGDVKLGALVGLTLGAGGGMLALAFAFVIGGVYGSVLLATRRATRSDAVRFGPFIAGGTVCASMCAALRIAP